mmetsp:Transcript_85702/g.183684  ORF Transcript_85702/g.183684 Transcript_85702/m.183684 type:complete len:234 (+) Transcript_85702:140-841(+)
MQASSVGTGYFSPMTMPRSSSFASSAATHIATRSPWIASWTGCLNICRLRTFFPFPASPKDGSTMPIWGFTDPDSTVPVSTVPWPLMGKAWSNEKMKGPDGSRFGMMARLFNTSIRPSTPKAGAPSPGLAEHQAKGSSGPNFVLEKVCRNFFSMALRVFARAASGIMSTLFRMTTIWLARISATTRHSAVCGWMPLLASMTSAQMSMICAPPMTVRISEAWPGQSTRQNWMDS